MAKRATKPKKRAQLPLTEQPRSFMDYVTGTSRLSRTPAQPKQNVLSKAGANFKGLMKQLPTANPFEFDDTVAKAAKLPAKNRTMKKKRSAKAMELSTEDAPKQDAPMRKHRAIKKSGSFNGKSNKLGFGGRAAQMKAQGVPGGVIGAIARKEGAAPGGPNYHGGKKRVMTKKRAITKKRSAAPYGSNQNAPGLLPGIDVPKLAKSAGKAIGNAAGKATGWPRGLNDMSLNKSGTVGTEPISKGNNKYTEIKAGPLGKLDIPMGTLKRKKSAMPQRKTNKSMTGMQLLRKATKLRR